MNKGSMEQLLGNEIRLYKETENEDIMSSDWQLSNETDCKKHIFLKLRYISYLWNTPYVCHTAECWWPRLGNTSTSNIHFVFTCLIRIRIQMLTWPNANAWFTFSLRQHETRQEWECEGYIRLVCHIFDLFLPCLEALGNILVNQSQIKGNENVSPRYRRYCDYILVQFLNIDCGLKFSEKCGWMKLNQLSIVTWLSRVVPVS